MKIGKYKSGGDAAEDWVGGYNLSINGINWRNGKKLLFMYVMHLLMEKNILKMNMIIIKRRNMM